VKIKVSAQVVEFVRGLSPDPRRRLRLAIRSLARGGGDVRALEGDLADYWRLSVGSYRVIFWRSATIIECVFAEKRSIVYEIFAEELRRKLAGL
jgi:mRNA-degrading endonuclease RelE of RelBE toxin-antitoxin system